MINSGLEEMYHHLVFKCLSFEHKKEYVLNHPELYSPVSLATLESIIERSEGTPTTLLRLHRKLLTEIQSQGVEDTFRDYGYVDSDAAQMFFQYANDSSIGITACNIKTQNKLCNLDDSTKIKLINWFIAGYPGNEERLPFLKACIGLGEPIRP